MRQLWAAALVMLCAQGCAHDAQTSDAGAGSEQDAAPQNTADAGGSVDAQTAEAGSRDAAINDAAVRDAAISDASVGDASKSDSGQNADASMPKLGPLLMPGDPGKADVMVEVRAEGDLHPISSLIYGSNGAPELARTHQTVLRSGGNRLTAYNWENNASNAGSDYQFQNDNLLSQSNDPAKPILDGISEAAANNAAAIVTVPIVDYVSADKNGGGDVRNSGSNYLSTRFKQNKPDKGAAPAATPDTSDAFVYQNEFVAYLKNHVPAASRVLFSLDNEPDLWSSTHAEVHPKPVTYAELWDRTQRFATAIKAAWPDSAVLGPVSYGWNGYVNLQNASDAGGRDFIEWYLDQAKAAEAKQGTRLIDYLDLHWYPEAQGGGTRVTEAVNSADVVAAREQAPRSLWDKSYNEKSWVHDSLNGPIDLIHRMQSKIDAHYPGTKLAISEWNYGGGNHISGAIACADVLGSFGRDGVGLATYWPLSDKEPFTWAAFRAYRNYDGAGGTFGDVSVPATSSDIANVTVYASMQSDVVSHVVIVVINKATTAKSVGLQLAHPDSFTSAKLYELNAAGSELMTKPDLASVAKNAWLLTLPAQSVTVIAPQH